MAGPARQSRARIELEAALRERPEAFEFFEAVRRLERAYPERPRLGRSVKASDDMVRFGQQPSMAFATRMIQRFKSGNPARLDGLFFGLFGPNGPLPLHLTEYAMQRQQARDNTFVAFANVFHHRMVSLFYRAWADAQPTVQMDRPADDRFSWFVRACIGRAMPSQVCTEALPESRMLFFAGRLLAQSRGPEGLRCLLEHGFKMPIHVLEFQAHWMQLPDLSRLRVGTTSAVAGLGTTAVIGERVRNCQHRFRVRVGPLKYTEFVRLLPGGDDHHRFVSMVHSYAQTEQSWELQLVLRRSDVSSTRLGRIGKLGLTSWLGSFHRPGDAEDVVLGIR